MECTTLVITLRTGNGNALKGSNTSGLCRRPKARHSTQGRALSAMQVSLEQEERDYE